MAGQKQVREGRADHQPQVEHQPLLQPRNPEAVREGQDRKERGRVPGYLGDRHDQPLDDSGGNRGAAEGDQVEPAQYEEQAPAHVRLPQVELGGLRRQESDNRSVFDRSAPASQPELHRHLLPTRQRRHLPVPGRLDHRLPVLGPAQDAPDPEDHQGRDQNHQAAEGQQQAVPKEHRPVLGREVRLRH